LETNDIDDSSDDVNEISVNLVDNENNENLINECNTVQKFSHGENSVNLVDNENDVNLIYECNTAQKFSCNNQHDNGEMVIICLLQVFLCSEIFIFSGFSSNEGLDL